MAEIIDNLKYERELTADGFTKIAGVDEVGRGPLAGNVVCAAVIMDLNNIIEGVTDSKKLSEKKRESLYGLIMERAAAVCIAEVAPEVIDLINIKNATLECMREAVAGLHIKPDMVIVDAERPELEVPSISVIKGDLYSYNVAAASIVAKVYRDRQMRAYAAEYPGYGFERHKGYGTAEHIAALRSLGASPIHRKSFIGHFIDIKSL